MSAPTNRRAFLRDGLLLTAGAGLGGLLMRSGVSLPVARAGAPAAGSAERRVRDLGLDLPPTPKAVATYVPAVRVGNMLYVSGHGPRDADGKLVFGKVGDTLTLEAGNAAARLVGLNVLSTIRGAIGSLDNVVRLVKTLGMVNSAPDFGKQPQVINGFSDLMVEVFGEAAGKGARSAVGVASLPSNIAVEIESVFQIRG